MPSKRKAKKRRKIKACHAVISDACRMGKTSMGAFDEASKLLRQEYVNLLDSWPVGRGARFHVELHVEYKNEATNQR